MIEYVEHVNPELQIASPGIDLLHDRHIGFVERRAEDDVAPEIAEPVDHRE